MFVLYIYIYNIYECSVWLHIIFQLGYDYCILSKWKVRVQMLSQMWYLNVDAA